jgi:aspartate/methionine/tyrosine aminotransferase
VRKKAKLLYLNYPNNPTGAGATRAFFREVVQFAKDNGIIVVHDAAYAGIMYGSKPLSFLSVPGAKEVGVEIHSLSKAYNMTGWRLAFVAGNARVIAGYGTVKDNYDSGQFKAIQKAGVYALGHPEITASDLAGPRLQGDDACGHLLSLRRDAEGRQGRTTVRERRGVLRVPDHREADQHRSLGRCGPLHQVLGDF